MNPALQFDDLSRYDATGTNPIDHSLAIWDSSGNTVVIACAGPGCSSTWVGGFCATTISAAVAPGNYLIGGYVFANGSDGFVLGGPTITTDPRITYGQFRFNLSGVLTDPTNTCREAGYSGPNLSAAVPESASLTLTGLGIGITTFLIVN